MLHFHDSHRHWPVYPVCPGASTSPAPWLASDADTAAKDTSDDCRGIEAPPLRGFLSSLTSREGSRQHNLLGQEGVPSCLSHALWHGAQESQHIPRS